MATFSIDDSELRALAADLTNAAIEVAPKAHKALNESSKNIRDAMRADAAKSRHFRFSGRISVGSPSDFEREIGAEKGGAGSLAHIGYFGGANGGGGTIRDPQHALDDEAPNFEKALGDAIDEALQ